MEKYVGSLLIYNIEWCFDEEEEIEELSKVTYIIDFEEDDKGEIFENDEMTSLTDNAMEIISNKLSDYYGFCHYGYEWKVVPYIPQVEEKE